MNINVTLVGQMITFAILVWVTMQYIWPPIMTAMEERQATIAQGLKDAEERARLLREGEAEAASALSQAKSEAAGIVKQAESRAAKLVEEAKNQAHQQAQRVLERAHAEIALEKKALREAMVKQVGQLVIDCSGKFLAKQMDAESNARLLAELVADVGERT